MRTFKKQVRVERDSMFAGISYSMCVCVCVCLTTVRNGVDSYFNSSIQQ